MNEKSCDTRCSMSASLGLLVLRLVAGLSLAINHGWVKFHDPDFKSKFFSMVGGMQLVNDVFPAWVDDVLEKAHQRSGRLTIHGKLLWIEARSSKKRETSRPKK